MKMEDLFATGRGMLIVRTNLMFVEDVKLGNNVLNV